MALTKIDDRGLKTPIDLLDNEKIRLGTGNDLELYHDGTLSYIKNNTAKLVIRSDTFQFGTADGTHRYIDIPTDEQGVSLFYDDGKKFETTSAGVTVTGSLTTGEHVTLSGQNPRITFTDSNHNPDFELYGSAGNFKIWDSTNNVGRLVVTADGNIQLPSDNIPLQIGAGQDLQIYHDGTDSIISHQGGTGGDLILQTTGSDDDVFIKCNDDFIVNVQGGAENAIIARNNGEVELYYDASKKFETTNVGATFSGNAFFPDNYGCQFGNAAGSADLLIYHDGSHSFIQDEGSGALRIRSDSEVAIQKWDGSTNENLAKFIPDGAVELYHNNNKKFETTSSGAAVTGSLGIGTASPGQQLHVYNSATDSHCYLKVENNRSRNAAIQLTTTLGSWYAGQGIGADVDRFMIYDSTPRFEIFSTGCVGINGINCNQFSEKLQVKTTEATGYGIAVRHTHDSVGSLMRFSTFDGSNEQLCGSINGSGTSTSFNTSSDYRLKENIVDFTDGITKLKTLKPKRFNWISDPTNTTIDGFLAHEVTAVPEAVWGTKDATEATYWTEDEKDSLPEGKEVGDVKNPAVIVPQQLDQSKLVPLITAALKETIAKIETLETKVAALEAA